MDRSCASAASSLYFSPESQNTENCVFSSSCRFPTNLPDDVIWIRSAEPGRLHQIVHLGSRHTAAVEEILILLRAELSDETDFVFFDLCGEYRISFGVITY